MEAAGPLLADALSGNLPTGQEIFNALNKRRMKLQTILLGNANELTKEFESAFDPKLSSVFTIPKVNSESESLWVGELTDIPEGNFKLGCCRP